MGFATLFVACQTDNIATEEQPTTPVVLTVTTNLNPETKAESINFDAEQSFYLYIDQAGSAYDYFATMSYQSGEWVAADSAGDPLEILLADLYSTITFAALACGDTQLTLEEFMAKSEYEVAGEDILYAKNGLESSAIDNDGKMSLEFTHLLSKLNITLDIYHDYLGDVASVEVTGLQDSFEWNASSNGTITSAGDQVDLSSYSADLEHEFIIAPQSVDSFNVVVTFDSGEVYISRYQTATKFESGTSYSLTVEIGEATPRDQVAIATIESGSWTTGGDYTLDVE